MSLSRLLLGLGCVLGISVGQIFFKLASTTLQPAYNFKSLGNLFLNKYLLISLFIYMVTTILWIWLLRLVPLRQAYPLIALAFLIVPILARVFLNEKFELRSIIGGIIIFIGVYVSVR